MTPILSVRHLASCIGFSPERLRQIEREIAADLSTHYVVFSKVDAKGKVRTFRNPRPELKRLQRRLLENVFSRIPVSNIAHGGIRGHSPATNATRHVGADWVATVDIRHFFPSVRHYIIYRMFRQDLRYGRDVARLLTRFTTVDSQLPQGAPTSTMLANMLLSLTSDDAIEEVSVKNHLAVTRFIDDYAISGADPRMVVNAIARALSRRRLRIWRKKAKLKIQPNSAPQEVTGLLVNSRKGPGVSKFKRDAIKAAIFQLSMLPPCERPKAVRSIKGRINHVRRFHAGSAARLDGLLGMRMVP